VLVLGVDTRVLDGYWLRGYFGYFGSANDPVTLDDVVTELGAPEVIPIPTPHDCIDGFAAAYWRRPVMYLDPSVRGCISGFAKASTAELAPGLARLAADLESGDWHRRNGALLELDTYDTGMRLVVA